VIPRGEYISISVVVRAQKFQQPWIIKTDRELPLDGIDEVCQDLILLHLPPPIRDDPPIIILWFKEDSGRMTTAVSSKIDGVVLPVFYQALDGDAITVNHLGSDVSVARASIYSKNELGCYKNCSETLFHVHLIPCQVYSWEDPIPPLSHAIHDAFVGPFNFLRVVFPAACGEFVIPAKAGIQKIRLDSVSSTE
jgi:hypothetical protein